MASILESFSGTGKKFDLLGRIAKAAIQARLSIEFLLLGTAANGSLRPGRGAGGLSEAARLVRVHRSERGEP